MKLCLYFTNDLMFSSRVKPMATQAGYELRFPGFEEAAFDNCDLVIFDLELISAADLAEVMNTLRAQSSEARTVAYAPHVKTGLLEGAQEAGVETVWSRGQFNKNVAQLFQ